MDKDGFGDHNQEIRVSACPSGYVDNNLDCNDQDGLINPEAHKLCDEKDNDCDGLIDDEGALDCWRLLCLYSPGYRISKNRDPGNRKRILDIVK
ncbi:MAG: putative metal-binding motif-containing protein [bacterium]